MSLFEQYEKVASQGFANVSSVADNDLNTQNEGVSREVPIFRKHRIEFTPQDVITHMAVSNNHIVLALRNKKLYKINLNQKGHSTLNHPIEVDLSTYLGEKSSFTRLYQLYLSPSGKHCILSFYHCETPQSPITNDNYYLGKRPRQITKMKNHQITALGWNFEQESQNLDSTSTILLGTNKGLIFETELTACDEYKWTQIGTGFEPYCRQVFSVNCSEAGAITAIEFHRVENTSDKTYFVIVTTRSRLYQFVGSTSGTSDGSGFSQIFNTSSNQFQDMPGNLDFSKLDFYYPKSFKQPETFAWLTEPGVLYGKLDIASLSSSANKVTSDATLIPYSPSDTEVDLKSLNDAKEKEKPISMILTRFHVLVLFKRFLRIICVVNEEIVAEDPFVETYGSVVGITKDVVKGTIWAFSEKAVHKYKECALKFMQLGDEEALKEFLIHKLDVLSAKEETQITLLLLWLIDIIMNQMSEITLSGNTESENYSLLKGEFQSLMAVPKVSEIVVSNRKAIYDLISSHGNEDCLIYFAKLINDYKVVIEFYLERRKWDEILAVLESQRNVGLIYYYSPILMKEVPKKLINVLKRNSTLLHPPNLLPALMQLSEDLKARNEQCTEVMRFLEHCVDENRSKDAAIHNYLLALYAEMAPEKLLEYLEKIENKEETCYDLNFALRICKEKGLQKACVILYTLMGLYEEAVDLALFVDIDLAKKTAEQSDLDDDLRKKLWLKIAKHVVTQGKDIHQVTELLKECNLVKIEDVLPYFPDFVTISHFKFAICNSLQMYNNHIETLKEEMRDATQRGQEIREEVKALRNRYTVVKAEDKCSICNYAVLMRAFYMFPCRHMFHADCLATELAPNLKPQLRLRLEEIEKQLNQSSLKIATGSDIPSKALNKEKLQSEFDDIVASECIYCGEIMIKNIDLPFILPEETNEALEGW
ncbi:vacuolar protein sorting-associated protein 18-like protein [Dinothrombium tinctorium]|uniref:Vacuolar protein sorting-associated protein 18 homolog n=1 Tax=Dinothrombium tinctorium TaxID=1965070 RepID=A0A3S3PIX0_9ACAR|nr:vacuolar protein sorting-associated protein 18-like protein [Dinothrombium tinctorium]RWS10497.1 vacuolar protein sorting-associated protein 18-like protein [Dinothrombium tinctorium]